MIEIHIHKSGYTAIPMWLWYVGCFFAGAGIYTWAKWFIELLRHK